jgi:diaminohydroxyphosphoribosylaminopyrimidine deaminase/5-amino-6-(5-phosphoribosylamino)uracil reductase
MNTDEHYMQHCLRIAASGSGFVAPNPLVGAVVVFNNEIIGEGYHMRFGGPHAEVNAIAAVNDKSLLAASTVYVNLEPCAHFGKTPPCADLLIKHQVKRVVVGCTDPNPQVAGKGIQKLREAGIEVTAGVLEQECRELNRKFITAFEKKRPFVTLKWAETGDGFIDRIRKSAEQRPEKITGEKEHQFVHQLRASSQAILAGTNTLLLDNPQLNVRFAAGHSPLRVIIDRTNRLPRSLQVFDGSVPALVFTSTPFPETENIATVVLQPGEPELPQVLEALYRRSIHSLFVEGGSTLLNAFIAAGLWDEAYVFKNNALHFGEGVAAPAWNSLNKPGIKQQTGFESELYYFRNV